MNHSITLTPRRLILLGVFGLLAVLTYGFAANNTVPASNAGDGSNAISGYAVSNVHYSLNSGNPSVLTNITFTVTPGLAAGGATRISLDSGSTWLTCTSSGPGPTSNITCSTTMSVLALGNLRVVAAQ